MPEVYGRPHGSVNSHEAPAGFSMNCPETNLWRTLEMNV